MLSRTRDILMIKYYGSLIIGASLSALCYCAGVAYCNGVCSRVTSCVIVMISGRVQL